MRRWQDHVVIDLGQRAAAAVADGRRAQNKRDKRNRIVGAARALFHAQGYRQTTTQQVAKAAGIAVGSRPASGNSAAAASALRCLRFAREVSNMRGVGSCYRYKRCDMTRAVRGTCAEGQRAAHWAERTA